MPVRSMMTKERGVVCMLVGSVMMSERVCDSDAREEKNHTNSVNNCVLLCFRKVEGKDTGSKSHEQLMMWPFVKDKKSRWMGFNEDR
jgi:hypothetical protein